MDPLKKIAVTAFMCAQLIFMYSTAWFSMKKQPENRVMVWSPLVWLLFLIANVAWVVISMFEIDRFSALAGVSGVFMSVMAIIKIRSSRKKTG